MTTPNRTVHIPVRVTRTRPRVEPGSTQAPVQPPAPPKTRPPLRPRSIHALPIEKRRRMMWFAVAIGMVIILFGWAMNLGHELRQPGREVSLLQQIGDLFKTFQPGRQPQSPEEEEIRQLEEQVFPQF